MPKKQGSIGSLLQGVSQQNFRTRLQGFHETVDNFIPDVTKGIVKRPPIESISALTSTIDVNSTMHYIRKDSALEYILIITDGDIKVFDLLGVEQTLSINNAIYLASTNVKEDISLVTVGDYTIINNKNITPLMGGNVSTSTTGSRMLQILKGEFNFQYRVDIFVAGAFMDGVLAGNFLQDETVTGGTSGATGLVLSVNAFATFHRLNIQVTSGTFSAGELVTGGSSAATLTNITNITLSVDVPYAIIEATPDGSSASHGAFIKTDRIALDLVNNINANTYLTNLGYFAERNPSNSSDVFRVFNTNLTLDTNLKVNLSQSNLFIADITEEVKTIGNLPLQFIHDRKLKISNDSVRTEDDFYMTFVGEDITSDSIQTGVWKETVADAVTIKINPLFAPNALVRLADGTFYFGSINGTVIGGTTIEEWSTRQVGADDTNPLPSWIGRPIEHISVFQQRLVILSDEFITTSKTSEFFNFFRTTATEVIDSDAIEISPVSGGINLMKRTVHQEKDLIIFSDNAQYILKGDVALTPSTVALTVLSTYTSNTKSELISTGDSILFPVKNNNFSGIKELFISKSSNVRSAQDISILIPEFLVGEVTRSEVDTNLGMVIYQTNDLKTLYVYKYLNSNNERLQSAWFRFNFNIDVVDYIFYNEGLLLLTKDTSSMYLNTLDFNDTKVTGLDYNFYIDQREEFTSVNTSVTSVQDVDSNLIVIQGNGCPNKGFTVDYTNVGNVLTLEEDMTGGTVYIGKKYSCTFKPTAPRIFTQEGKPTSRGRFLINTLIIDFIDTVRFTTTSIAKGTTYTKEYEGVIAGESLIGVPDISDGSFKVGIKETNDNMDFSITSDTHFPVNITQIDFEGVHNPLAKR